jgi:phosphonate transport system substrate-binding protein
MRARSAWIWLVLVSWLATAGRSATAAGAIEIAITPFLPARITVQNYEPMRLFLEKQLKQPVLFITAPDYKTFHERTQRQEYDYLITVANAAYLAQADSAYIPLFRPAIDTRPTLVVATGNPLQRVADLRGKTVTLPDRLAVVSMQAISMLEEAGLDPEHDVSLLYQRNHGAAVNMVLSGEASAAIVSDRALTQMDPAVKNAVRVVQAWDKGAAPGVVYLASPKLSKQEISRFSHAVHQFVESAEGRALMQRLGYGTLLPASPDDLKPLAPYGATLKEALSHSEPTP